MKLLVLTITFFCIASSLFSQTIFEKGYIIDNSNDKINCFIKDLNWLDNPESFEYKIQIDGEVLTGLAENIKEFGILNYVKYRRFSVDIDQSSNNINQLNSERNPVFVNQTVFLKSIIEGNASLFEYSKGNLNRYFFSLDTSDIKPLIYKQYRNQDYKVEENATFRQTLYNAFKCSELSLNNFKYLKYNSNELKKIFIKYNECTGDQYEIVEHQKGEGLFNLIIKPGLNVSSFSMYHNGTQDNIQFESSTSFRLGVDFEYVLPFNNNRWAIFIEPTYGSFQGQKEIDGETFLIDYKTMDFPIGFKYSYFINQNLTVIANVIYVPNLEMNSFIQLDNNIQLELSPSKNAAFGIGMDFKKKYSFEIRIRGKRDLLVDYGFWTSNYNGISFMVGYNIF